MVGENWSRLPVRRTVGEVRGEGKWGRRASGKMKKRMHSFMVRFRREMSMSHAMPQPWQWVTRHVGKRRCKPIGLHYFYEGQSYVIRLSLQEITRLEIGVWSCRKEWKNLAAFSTREREQQQQRKEKERSIPRQENSKSRSKKEVIPTRPLQIETRETFVGVEDWRKRYC